MPVSRVLRYVVVLGAVDDLEVGQIQTPGKRAKAIADVVASFTAGLEKEIRYDEVVVGCSFEAPGQQVKK